MHHFSPALLGLLIGGLLLVGCVENPEPVEEPPAVTPDEDVMVEPAMAMVTLMPTEGNEAEGTVTFTQLDNAIRVEANLTNVPPGDHGFHIHENGDCSDNGQAAGGHFAPRGNPHGGPDAAEGQRHVGDLGNVMAGADGTVSYTRVDSVLAFSGTHDIVGKAVILHADADDLTTQPTGAAGGRIACGIITMDGDAMMDGDMQDGSADESM